MGRETQAPRNNNNNKFSIINELMNLMDNNNITNFVSSFYNATGIKQIN
jgi:hypothetical protein